MNTKGSILFRSYLLGMMFFVQFGYSQELPKVESYVCYRASSPIVIDGKLDEQDWNKAQFSKLFGDIEGATKPEPLHDTKVKMLWDDNFFYIAALLEEPHLWATYTQRESVIFHENDFEIFIDPDGDTHNYYEIEINALNTVWDLLLTKPYRDGGKAVTSWNIDGLETAVHLYGTLNDPTDVDSVWTVEFAIPWASITEFSSSHDRPMDQEQWKINFSRVQWQLDIQDQEYKKRINPDTGKPYPEYNWVWSPQGVINMHQPETWGIVQFSSQSAGDDVESIELSDNDQCKWELRKVYYEQKNYKRQHGAYAQNLDQLALRPDTGIAKDFKVDMTHNGYQATVECKKTGISWCIREDGLVWRP